MGKAKLPFPLSPGAPEKFIEIYTSIGCRWKFRLGKGGNISRLVSWRGLAKPFSNCGGQAGRIPSVKNLLIAMSFFLLIFLWGVPLTSASGETVVTEKDNGKEIQVKVGDVIELSLEELGSAGYTWEIRPA